MKRKFILVALSIVLTISMIPLNVFAKEQNNNGTYEIPEVPGIYLTGDHQPVKGDDPTSDADYYYNENNDTLCILTSNWKVTGVNEFASVSLADPKANATITLGDLSVYSFTTDNAISNEVIIDNGCKVNAFHDFAVQGDERLTGNGTLNVFGMGIVSYVNAKLTIDGPTIKATSSEKTSAVHIESGLTVKSGKLIAINNQEDSRNSFAIRTDGNFTVSDEAEVFACGIKQGICFELNSPIDQSKFLGSAEMLSYDEKDDVKDKTTIVGISLDVPLATFSILEENTAILAKTVYHPAVVHPEPVVHNVTFVYQNGQADLVKEVEEGDTVAKPENPVREGYTFTGWFDNEETQGNTFDFDTPIMNDITLYAGWSKESPTPAPTPTPTPTPSGGDSSKSAQGGITTGDNGFMPIIFIGLGITAGITAFVISRRLRNK